MRFLDFQTMGAALVLLLADVDAHSHSHSHSHSHAQIHQARRALAPVQRRHSHSHPSVRRGATSPRASPFESALERRGTTCPFPSDAGLVAVAPEKMNGGWAMAPDVACKSGLYCPYACPPGQVMAQWDPKATSYTYPQSMNGGLYCGDDGKATKPFPDKPYCVDGVGTVKVQNLFDDVVSVCQTVLPGDESMVIPTAVQNEQVLAVPGTDYWCKTSAHYYVNPPGYGTKQACVWGDDTAPIGNWAPYVTGANQDGTGKTFLTLGWNPIFIDCPLSKTLPDFGLRIECDGDCVGLPCSIDPTKNGLNKVTSATSATGAGGADFCVVTVPQGASARVVVFDVGAPDAKPNSGSGSASSSTASSSSASTEGASSSTTGTASSTTGASEMTSTTAGSQTTTANAVASYAPGVLFQNDTTGTNGSIISGRPGSNGAAPGGDTSASGTSNATPVTWSLTILSVGLMTALMRLL